MFYPFSLSDQCSVIFKYALRTSDDFFCIIRHFSTNNFMLQQNSLFAIILLKNRIHYLFLTLYNFHIEFAVSGTIVPHRNRYPAMYRYQLLPSSPMTVADAPITR